jgi:probable F420-dependent oxidoreductase
VRLEVALGLWQDRPPGEAVPTARLVDELGFPALWIGEMATYDAFALATHVGAAHVGAAHVGVGVNRAALVLGPLAVTVRDPMMIAMGAASVADLTGRPVSVALGTSSPVVVEEWHGRSRSRSARALAESARAVRSLLDGEKADVPGEVVGTRGYRLRLPAPRSELVVAAFGTHAIRTAAAVADRMVLNLVDPPTAGALVATLAEEAARLGRTPPRVAVWAPAAIDVGPVAFDQLRRGVVGYLAAPGYAEMFERAGFADVVALARARPHPRDLLAAVPDELVTTIGVVGPQDEAHRRIREYARHGVDDVVLVPSATDADPAAQRTLRAAAELTVFAGSG